MPVRHVELLAPARDYDAGRAAVDFGADALYIGGPQFGARTAASNSVEQIAHLVQYARPFGVRVYAALNTLVYEHELAHAKNVARELIAAGVDALIVQDMAFLRMGLSGVEFHASTQMHNITPQGIGFLQKCGFSRVILERGLTLEQIKNIRAATTVSLEAFVHGAICVCYSGRCYLGRATGGRSGNRGECSQPCRLSWDLCDASGREVIKGKHLLSVRDLDLSSRIADLLNVGVNSFKIEGRLKDISYVKNIVAHYRRAIDAAMSPGMERASAGRSVTDFTPDPLRSFTRGASTYFLDGKTSGTASFDTPKAIGMLIGKVTRIEGAGFRIAANETLLPGAEMPSSDAEMPSSGAEVLSSGSGVLSPGDGICFLRSSSELQGTNVNMVQGNLVVTNTMDGIVPGIEIYRNYDHRFVAALQNSRTRRTIDIRARVEFSQGSLTLHLEDATGITASASIDGFDPARDPEKMRQTILTQLSRSGEFPFEVTQMDISQSQLQTPTQAQAKTSAQPQTFPQAQAQTSAQSQTFPQAQPQTPTQSQPQQFAPPFVPLSRLNALRREAMERLLAARAAMPPMRELHDEDLTASYPIDRLTPAANVTNSLAEKFYRDHGVREIAPGYDLSPDLNDPDLHGAELMRTPYCIRREIGQCLRQKHTLKGPLHLTHGRSEYLLSFDCDKCEMTLSSR